MKVYALLLLALTVSCTPQKSDSTNSAIDEATTKRVLDHHWATFQANDLEGTMADYTEESVLITPDRTYRGLNEIRENFVNAFKAFPSGDATLTLNKSVVSGDVGYILWEASTPAFNLTYATDTFIIQNGKIIRQTYAGVATAK